MEKMLLRIFQREVERQCRFALLARDDLDQALRENDSDRVWSSVQSFLVAVGNVSKLLWQPDSREILRQSLDVDENSPLQPRTFRNHFEHFDERLERWATSSARRNIVDSNIGPPGSIVGIEPGDYIRNFDTQNYAVTFRGGSYELRPIIEAIKDLHNRAALEANKPYY